MTNCYPFFDRFLESEMELNEIIHEMHVIATVPDLYHMLVELNAVQSLLQLLNHDNTGNVYNKLCMCVREIIIICLYKGIKHSETLLHLMI